MQFEDFDIRVRQAAEQHHPEYDERAWAKMEKLLDKHMPQKDDRRRRPFFFLLLFLLVGTGAYLIFFNPWKQQATGNFSQQTTSQTNTVDPIGVRQGDGTKKENKQSATDFQTSPSTTIMPASGSRIGQDVLSTNNETRQPAAANSSNLNSVARNNPNREREISSATKPLGNSKNAKAGLVNEQKTMIRNDQSVSASANQPVSQITSSHAVLSSVHDKEDLQRSTTTLEEKAPVESSAMHASANSSKPLGPKKRNTFFVTLSAGPDVSYIRMNDAGKVKLLTGAAFGFSLKNRWTIRTGFYVASKLYRAAASDYKPNYAPPNLNYLEDVDANCRVYEIPLSLAYNIVATRNTSVFASVGLSSYIMKKEDYSYNYKYPGGATYSHAYSFSNENNHVFSVLGLSAGYERSVTRNFAVMAEPYIRVPLAGLGQGNVKLGSAGLLISARYNLINMK